MNSEKNPPSMHKGDLANGAASNLNNWEFLINKYGIPVGQYLISTAYALYARLTLFNVIVFLVKFVPTGIYMYKFMKNIYKTSRERLKQKQSELEDIQLQIQIINTKLSVQEAEFVERVEELKKSVDRLKKVRARVRSLIQSDEELRQDINTNWTYDAEVNAHCMHEEECEFIVELLKELKCEQVAEWEQKKYGQSSGEPVSQDNSIYSSISDTENKQDCHVKIVKVTNVYKVAYLKHYIKQKRLRRANRHALLKKKMDNIKKLLEDWQNTLSMVINSKLTLLNINPKYIEVPQEAMGDCSQGNYRDFSDSDSDLRNNIDNVPDEYCMSWSQNAYMNQRSMCVFNREDYETAVSKEPHDEEDVINERYEPIKVCDYKLSEPGYLAVLPEEALSQLAIEEIGSEASEDGDCRDLVAM